MTKTGGKQAASAGYLTTQEVADRLRVTRRTVYNWISQGLLVADKAGPKIWLVSEAQLQAFTSQGQMAVIPELAATKMAKRAAAARPSGGRPSGSGGPPQRAGAGGPSVPVGFDLRNADNDFEADMLDRKPKPAQAPAGPSSLQPAQIAGKKKQRGGRRR